MNVLDVAAASSNIRAKYFLEQDTEKAKGYLGSFLAKNGDFELVVKIFKELYHSKPRDLQRIERFRLALSLYPNPKQKRSAASTLFNKCVKDNSDKEQLFAAYRQGYLKLVEKICEYGLLRPTLHYAAYEGHVEMVKLMAGEGYDINVVQEEYGNTPLHAACDQRKFGVARELIRAGAKLNIQNKAGDTPLNYACYSQSMKTSTLLFLHGADPSIRNLEGKAPLDQLSKREFTLPFKYFGGGEQPVADLSLLHEPVAAMIFRSMPHEKLLSLRRVSKSWDRLIQRFIVEEFKRLSGAQSTGK